MKNNVISIFVDSVTWEAVGTKRAKVSPTPFLDSLKGESVTASNLYSHGPYTDAAKTSLYTGRNCLDDFGYYFRENTSPTSDFKLFHDEGYETYCFSYPFWLYGKNLRQYIDHQIYTASFVYRSEWGGMFKYYSELSKERELNNTEFFLLKSRLSLFFDAFSWYLSDIINNEESNILISKCNCGYDLQKALNTLLEEKRKFEEHPVEYIKDFNDAGLNHVLSTIDTTHIDSIIDGQFLNEVYKENQKFFRKIILNNLRVNGIKLFPSIKRLYYGIMQSIKSKCTKPLLFLFNYVYCLNQFQIMRKRWDKPRWQNDNTIHSILQAGLELIKKRTDKEKPFYMYLNTDDPHSDISMFAYDIQDKKEINCELNVLKEYVERLGTNYKGSLLYFLSLRYVDYEIEKFCNCLKELGLWENTTLLVLSDHGSSYTFYPLHNSRVNCFDDECYHIPVLLRHPGFKGIEVNTYQNSKDIYPTVCDLLGIGKPIEFSGHSMLDPNRPQHNYVITEYMGPGCPDMTARRMWLSIRDKHYVVAYKVGIYEPFEEGELAEVYDLQDDPNAYYNINYKIDRNRIEYLLIPLKERYEEIKRDTNIFIDKLKKGEIDL